MGELVNTLENAIVIDFETMPIQPRPEYPPRPVGVAITARGKAPKYYTKIEMIAQVKLAFNTTLPLIFHNAGFDLAVAMKYCGVRMPAVERIHDTLTMLFLRDPYASTYALKPSAETILGLPPTERDEVVEWLVENQPEVGECITRKNAGAYIAYAPEELVSRYARGDVERTYQLALKVGAELEERGMVEAYRSEIALLPVIMDMEERGVRVDVAALRRDVELYTKTIEKLDKWLIKKLNSPSLNLDSDGQLVAALVAAGLADESKLEITETGKRSASKDSLAGAVTDPVVLASLRYRGVTLTCLRTFMRPWLEVAKKGGRIYTSWFTTRKDEGGARTGRLSSSPNLMNIPKTVKPIFVGVKPPVALPPPPAMRSYILPEKGHVLIDRDFASQEIRVLAHFEDGAIANEYILNPNFDLHQYVADQLGVDRGKGKTLNLAIIYGLGNRLLAERLGCSVEAAREHKADYFRLFPGIRELSTDIQSQAKAGLPIRTWGGRTYYVESPKIINGKERDFYYKLINGKERDFYYKLINYLVQGSSADITKSALVAYHAARGDSHLIASVHDELLISCPKKDWKRYMTVLKNVMARPLLDVPLTSTGKVGPNWADMKECD